MDWLQVAIGVFVGLLAFNHRQSIWYWSSALMMVGLLCVIAIGIISIPFLLFAWAANVSGMAGDVIRFVGALVAAAWGLIAWGIGSSILEGIKEWLKKKFQRKPA